MEKYKYAPGMPGYGSPGTDGSVGLGGLAFFTSDIIATTAEGITKLTYRIQNNLSLMNAEPPDYMPGYDEGRRYQTGDTFLDYTSTIYMINLDDDPPWQETNMTVGGGDSIFYNQGQVEIPAGSGNYYKRYANTSPSQPDARIVDFFVSTNPEEYLDDRGPLNNYTIPKGEFGQIFYNDLNTRNYNAYTLWSAALDPLGVTDPEKSIGLVRNIADNNWRLGNIDLGGSIRNAYFSLDFQRVGVNRGTGSGIPSYALDVTGSIRATTQFVSTVATGTAPFLISSTTPVANLNIGGNAATATLATTATNIAGGSNTSIPYQTGSGTTALSDPATLEGQFLKINGGVPTWVTVPPSGVSNVTASLPLASSGGSTPNLTITQAGAGSNGYLSSADWTTFNNKSAAFTNSAQLRGLLSDETGSGAAVFADSPVLTTPNIGAATATSVNKIAITAPAAGATLTIANGATLTVSATGSIQGTNTGDQDLSGKADVGQTMYIGQTAVTINRASAPLTLTGVSLAGFSGINGDGVAKITVGTTQPVGPAVGDLWVDTNI